MLGGGVSPGGDGGGSAVGRPGRAGVVGLPGAGAAPGPVATGTGPRPGDGMPFGPVAPGGGASAGAAAGGPGAGAAVAGAGERLVAIALASSPSWFSAAGPSDHTATPATAAATTVPALTTARIVSFEVVWGSGRGPRKSPAPRSSHNGRRGGAVTTISRGGIGSWLVLRCRARECANFPVGDSGTSGGLRASVAPATPQKRFICGKYRT